MTPTRPTASLDQFPEGTREVVYAKDQPEYTPLPVYLQPDGTVHTCWMPSEEEIRAILAGEPIVIEVLTFGRPLQPLRVFVPGREQ
jgi:hypothetical protein